MIALVVATVLACISALHVYWALGGHRGIAVAIPTIDGRPAFTPSPLATWVVAFGLAAAALVALLQGRVVALGLPPRPVSWAAGLLALIFFVRAIGDFRQVGLFKRLRCTPFAVRDTWLYSPLCLLLALGFLHLLRK